VPTSAHHIPADVGQLARESVVAVPTAGIGTKGRELECRRCKVPAAGGQGHIDAVGAEADDVGHAVAVNVRKRARVEVLAGPAAGVGPEGGKLERGHRKVPASGVQGHIDAVSAETDDVGPAVAVHVGNLARVGVVAAPTPGHGTEGGKLERGHRKMPACGGERLVHAGSAEADDVGFAVQVYVGKFARVGVVAAPAASVGTEGGELERGHRKVPACGGQGFVDAGSAEGDDVGSGVPVYVCQRARVGVVAAPAAGVDAECGQLERGHRELPASGGERLVDAGCAEADDVGHAVAAHVRQRARVGIVAAPATGAGTKGRELECRRCKRRRDQDWITKEERVDREGNRSSGCVGEPETARAGRSGEMAIESYILELRVRPVIGV
jgi:hypothetical protein